MALPSISASQLVPSVTPEETHTLRERVCVQKSESSGSESDALSPSVETPSDPVCDTKAGDPVCDTRLVMWGGIECSASRAKGTIRRVLRTAILRDIERRVEKGGTVDEEQTKQRLIGNSFWVKRKILEIQDVQLAADDTDGHIHACVVTCKTSKNVERLVNMLSTVADAHPAIHLQPYASVVSDTHREEAEQVLCHVTRDALAKCSASDADAASLNAEGINAGIINPKGNNAEGATGGDKSSPASPPLNPEGSVTGVDDTSLAVEQDYPLMPGLGTKNEPDLVVMWGNLSKKDPLYTHLLHIAEGEGEADASQGVTGTTVVFRTKRKPDCRQKGVIQVGLSDDPAKVAARVKGIHLNAIMLHKIGSLRNVVESEVPFPALLDAVLKGAKGGVGTAPICIYKPTSCISNAASVRQKAKRVRRVSQMCCDNPMLKA
ncbi:hypothetical protein KIPB_004609 [Kipferlia bialata]|uniref:Uncharacterized protein n=1 Tax=Kipferlia bialata TaxID=797122 RepID=A0A9K3GID9_9EUKA|nr:hypothetical protein KIPB_004609 [Kipferlia bialata]|eukprot:g4609.t1